MLESSSASAGNLIATCCVLEPTVLTRPQQKKRAAIVQPEDPASAEESELPPSAPKDMSILQAEKSEKSRQRDRGERT